MGKIADLIAGYFQTTGDNETTIVSTKDDPPKHRLGVRWRQGWGRSLGALSFNKVNDNGSEDEHVLIQGKMTEGLNGGEFYLGLKQPGGSNDAAMIDALVASTEKGFRFALPVYAPNLSGGEGGSNEYATGISSRNGKYRLQVQDDGNLVYYDYSFTPAKVLAVLGRKE